MSTVLTFDQKFLFVKRGGAETMDVVGANNQPAREADPRPVVALPAPAERREADEESNGDVDDKVRMPEEKLNGMILRMAFLYRVMNGFGTLALIWASVVVLGGFSALIKRKDFWVIIIIVFLEATRIFSSHEKPEDQFFLLLPQALLKDEKFRALLPRGSWRRYQSGDEQKQDLLVMAQQALQVVRAVLFSHGFSFTFFFETLIGYAQLAAVFVCIVMSAVRLNQQDYVDAIYQTRDDHKNIRGSLNIFYGLILAQGISYFLMVILATPFRRILKVCLEYELGLFGIATVARYLVDNFMKCISGNLRDAMNMDLVTFAEDLVNSNSPDDQLVGVWLLDQFLRKEKYKQQVLLRLRASRETIRTLVSMLGMKSSNEQETRGHASRIVLELAPDLLVEGLPGMLQFVSSLLLTNERRISGSSNYSNGASMELAWFGVQILERLMRDPENCSKMTSTQHLLRKIIDLTKYSDGNMNSNSEIGIAIVETSLKVLCKLVGTAGDAGEALRREISDNVYILSNISGILARPESQTKLLVLETEIILACLALDDVAREEIGSSRGIIRKLMSLLLGETVQESTVRKAAAEALLMLASGGASNTAVILMETKPGEIGQLVKILSDEDREYRTVVAKLLKNLLAYSGAQYAQQLQEVIEALPLVLKAIGVQVEQLDAGSDHLPSVLAGMRTEQGKILESFIGLSVQICPSVDASHFGKSLAPVTVDDFVQKLKKLLDVYKCPTTDFPTIRRVTVQQLIRLMQYDTNYKEVFVRYEMDKALKEVAETASKLEGFELFYCGVGSLKHEQPLASLVDTAQALIAANSASEA